MYPGRAAPHNWYCWEPEKVTKSAQTKNQMQALNGMNMIKLFASPNLGCSLMYERCVARRGRRWAWAVIFYGFYVIFIWISQLFWDFLTISWASPFPSHARSARYTFVKAPIRTEIRPSPPAGRLLLYLILSQSSWYLRFLLRLIVAHCLTLNVNCPIKTELSSRLQRWSGGGFGGKINSKHHFSKSTLITTRRHLERSQTTKRKCSRFTVGGRGP